MGFGVTYEGLKLGLTIDQGADPQVFWSYL